MTLRKKYVLWYISTWIAPFLIFVLGTILMYSGWAKDASLGVPSLYLICFLIWLAGGFMVNYWYGGRFGLLSVYRILASIFSTAGFFYLMGQNKELLPALEIVKQSWELYQKNWKKLGLYALIFFIPTIVFDLIWFLNLTLSRYTQSALWINGLLRLFLIVIAIIFILWISIAFAQIIRDLLENRPATPFKSIMQTKSHLLWPTVYTTLLSALIILGGTLLFFIPGIIFSIWYAFTFYTIIFDGQKGVAALRTSKILVINRWFAILWRIAAPSFIFGLLAMAAVSIAQLSVLVIPAGNIRGIAEIIISNLVNTLCMPFTVAASVILYLNAKKTKPVVAEKPGQPIIM